MFRVLYELFATFICEAMFGIGSAFIYDLAVTSAHYWFQRFNTIAVDVCAFGGGFGAIAFRRFIEFLFRKFDYRTAIMLLILFSTALLVVAILQQYELPFDAGESYSD